MTAYAFTYDNKTRYFALLAPVTFDPLAPAPVNEAIRRAVAQKLLTASEARGGTWTIAAPIGEPEPLHPAPE